MYASSDDKDEDGNLTNYDSHSSELTEEATRQALEDFFKDPDFLGFEPGFDVLPKVTCNQGINALCEAIHQLFEETQKAKLSTLIPATI